MASQDPVASEPFFAVKIGPWSWFCLWAESSFPHRNSPRGRYESAPQESTPPVSPGLYAEDGRSATPGGSSADASPPRLRPHASRTADGGGFLRKLVFYLDRHLQQLGAFHLVPLESHRHRVLQIAMIMSEVSLLFGLLGFCGGLLGGEVTRYLYWMRIPEAGPDAFMGLRYVCARAHHNETSFATDSALFCTRLCDLNCTRMVPGNILSCHRCRHEAESLVVPMLITVVTSGRLAYSSVARRRDRKELHLEGNTTDSGVRKGDTAFQKAMTVAGAIFGGCCTLFALLFYRFSCGRLAADIEPNSKGHRSWGPGFWLMGLATFAKLLCGFLHLGLPALSGLKSLGIPQSLETTFEKIEVVEERIENGRSDSRQLEHVTLDGVMR